MRRALRGRAGVAVVAVTGLGPDAAAAAAAQWVGRVSGVVVCGLAGGLGDLALAGDVVVGCGVVDGEGRPVGEVAVVDVPGTVAGVVATVRRPVVDAAGLAALRGMGAVCVETEAGAWVRACGAAGVPVAVVRAVLDTPEAPLGAAAELVRPGAAGPRARDVGGLVLRPGAWPGLLRLGRAAGRAERAAAAAAVTAAAALSLASPPGPGRAGLPTSVPGSRAPR